MSVQQTAASSAANPKPVLNGVRIKTRKSEKKATKFEPTTFRDALLKCFEEIDCKDLAAVSAVLDVNGDELDYRRYSECFFELLFTGHVLAPGGGFVEDESGILPFCVFNSDDTVDEIRKIVDVFNKLIRRFKYLQISFEETTGKLLQYINKWPAADVKKFARSVGFLICSGLLPITVLNNLKKDHLVKEAFSLDFITVVFKTYLVEQSIDHLSGTLRKAQMESQLLEFFPTNKRTNAAFEEHFNAEGLEALVEYHKKKQASSLKDTICEHLSTMIKNQSSVTEVCAYFKQQLTKIELNDQELVRILWESVMRAIDSVMKNEQVDQMLLKHVNSWTKFLGTFVVTPKAQLALLCRIQVNFYEDARLTKHFRNVVTLLYKTDVISESAIMYWNEKGAAPQGKNVFTVQMEPFIQWLREAESEDDEEEEK